MTLPGRPVDRRRWFVYLVCVLVLVGVARWAFTHPFNGWSLVALLGSLAGVWGLLRFDQGITDQPLNHHERGTR